MTTYTVVECAECDGGIQILRIEEGEDCCAAARRAGGICRHGADGLRSLGRGATWDECVLVADRIYAERDAPPRPPRS